MSLPESLERAASELATLADKIRPANGDPHRLIDTLDASEASNLATWILDRESDDAAELIEAWCESDAGVAALLGVSEKDVAKPGRKLLRRALHRLRSAGVEAAAREEAAPAPKRKVITADEGWQAAHVSAPDFRGTRMGYLVDSHPSGGARLFEIRFDAARGIQDFKVYNAGRSKVRGFLKSLTENAGRRLFEVDRDALRALVWRAASAQSTERPLPSSYIEWRSRLFSSDLEKQATPGELIRTRLDEAPREAAVASLCEDVKAGRLGPWPPATSWVGDWMDRGREAVDGLEGEPRSEAIEAWIAEVSEALGAETDLDLIRGHLDELAWVRDAEDDGDGAKGLLALSGAIAEDEAARASLARARVESLFEPYLASLRVIEESPLED